MRYHFSVILIFCLAGAVLVISACQHTLHAEEGSGWSAGDERVDPEKPLSEQPLPERSLAERPLPERSLAERPLPERPMPRKIEIPEGYLDALEQGTRTSEGRPGEDYWQPFSEYDIEATLDPEKREITAVARITWYNNSPDEHRQLHLELVQNLHSEGVPRNRPVEVTGGFNLQRVVVNGTELPEDREEESRYGVQGTRMIVRLPEHVKPGESAELEIAYDFKIPQRGAAARMGYSDDNLFYLGYWYPHMVVNDDVVGWHGDPYLGQAEFYHGFADYNLAIHVPEDWIVMATGELQNAGEVLHPEVLRRWNTAKESDEPVRVYTAGEGEQATQSHDGHLAWRFSAERVRDVAFSATRESHWDAARTSVGDRDGDGTDDYTVINSLWREEASLWSEVAAYQQHAITFLSKLTGYPYPWPHMTAVEGSGIIGGGMEYPMMTIMGDYNQQGAEALYSVTAHELAHMWVPMTVSTDERRYSWIDEGNTVFSTAEAVMDIYPDKNPHVQAQNSYTRAARNNDEGPIMRRSDYHYSGQQFIIASYRKSSSVLAALRKLLGEEVFWKAYRTFIDEWAFKHAYPWDFFRTFERVSGRDLDWFWYSWYYETWVLDQAIEEVEETGEGIRIVVRDKGKVPMPVYLTVVFGDGTQLEHTIPVDPWLRGKRRTEVVIPGRKVRRVEIDEGRDLPDINRQNMIWEQE